MIVVIGATGFIGMYVVEELTQHGIEVIATGRNEALAPTLERLGASSFIRLDITQANDFGKLPTKGVEGVILLAGLLPANATADLKERENAADYLRVNTIGTANVLEWCRAHSVRKIVSSCSYGDTSGAWSDTGIITEDEPRSFSFTGDHAMYVVSKNAANDTIEYYNQQHGMQGSVFRFGPVYGVGPHGTILVNGHPYKSGIQTFIERAQEGKDLEVWGDPSLRRDLIYVKDVARAYRLALASERTLGLYNMTCGVSVSIEEQARGVIKVFGEDHGSRIVFRSNMPNNTPSYHYSMEKASRDFGFVPEYTDFVQMMRDYKAELESGRWAELEASAAAREE